MIKSLIDEKWKRISFYRNAFGKHYAISNMGRLVCYENKFNEALSDYNIAEKLQPENPKVYYNRGNLLGNKKKYNEAISDFSMAIKLKNDYALAYFGRGITECNSEKKEAGCKDLQNAIRSYGLQVIKITKENENKN